MKEPFGTVAGLDTSLVVHDRAEVSDREVKYAVDRFGLERLRFIDGTSPRIKARDRASRLLSRGLSVLPGRMGDGLLRRADRASERVDRLAARANRWRSQRRPLAGSGQVAVGAPLRPDRAVLVGALDLAAEEATQLTMVLDALERSAVRAVVLPSGPGKDVSLAIREDDVERAAAALAKGLDATWRLARLDAPRARPLRMTRRSVRRLSRAEAGFRALRLLAAGPDLPLTGLEVGVDVEVWRDPMRDARSVRAASTAGPRAEGDARLVAPRRQAWATRLPAEAWSDPAGAVDLGSAGALPHLFEVTGPIDVVYTWVDGADPEWNRRRAEALGAPNGVSLHPAATHGARFRSHDELRYSLRSLEMYAPWVRTVHLVTAGQVPYWLDTTHPRVNLVDHEDIFPDPTVLPVFNSHAIEACLHRIPGLAERYLYLNDDVFFARRVRPELFFHGNGLARFFPSTAVVDPGPRQAHDDAVTSAAKNNRELIARTFGRTTTTIFQHTPQPQLRSVLEHMERAHPEVFAQVAASPFRHPEDLSIPSSLHHHYAYALGKAVPGRLDYLYLDLGHPRAARRLRRHLRHRDVDVLCLNDTPDVAADDDERTGLLVGFLERCFPLPSSFELGSRAERSSARDHRPPAAADR